jgi:hypothetical protein
MMAPSMPFAILFSQSDNEYSFPFSRKAYEIIKATKCVISPPRTRQNIADCYCSVNRYCFPLILLLLTPVSHSDQILKNIGLSLTSGYGRLIAEY